MVSKAEVKELKLQYGKTQRYGAHFICASLLIWIFIFAVSFMNLTQYYKNMLSLYSSALLVPLALLFSKLLGIKFSDKENPLNTAGLVFALNQMLYLVIVILVWFIKPELMIASYAMVVGAHFLPYSWLYDSAIYRVFSIVITIGVFVLTITGHSTFIPLVMIVADLVMIVLFLTKTRKR